MLLLGHGAQLPWALERLRSWLDRDLDVRSDVDASASSTNGYSGPTGPRTRVIVSNSDRAYEQLVHQCRSSDSNGENHNHAADPSLLVIVPKAAERETQSKIIDRIVADFGARPETDSDASMFMVHGSLDVLKRCKVFLGEDA